jgi:hypothetical protein
MAKKMVFLNCPVCKCGIDVEDNGWSQICCPNCKIDIDRQGWVDRDVLEGKYLAHLEAVQQKMHPTGGTPCEICGRVDDNHLLDVRHPAASG